MNIVITGSKGYIANYLRNRFLMQNDAYNVYIFGRAETSKRKLDLTTPYDFDYSILEGIDYIIHTSAISGPDQCAEKYDECWDVNVTGTEFFLREALHRNCKVIFLSSDAVYGQDKGCVFTEESPLKADTAYGKMKQAIEKRFADDKGFKSIRLSYVVSFEDKFTSYCINCMRNEKVAEIFHPFYRNCITMTDVLDIVEWLIQNFAFFEPKTINAAGKELVSRVRIADELNRIYENRLQYKICDPPKGFFVNRPVVSQMDSVYLDQYHMIRSDSFSEKMRIEMKGVKI